MLCAIQIDVFTFSLLFRSIVVSGVKTVSGLAVDWISRNLYWVDREKVSVLFHLSLKLLVISEG